MKKSVVLLLSTFLLAILVSCRDDSDYVESYAYDEVLIFKEANSSLEGQFKAIWTAMNCNYPIWDYEEQQGLNWDKVYEKYLPQFKKLDSEFNNLNPVPDSNIINLYNEILSPLHDGHLFMYLKNIHTGKKINEKFAPQVNRNIQNHVTDMSTLFEEMYLEKFFSPTLKYYNEKGELKELIQEDNFIYAFFKDDIVYFRLPEFNLLEIFLLKTSRDEYERIYRLWESWFNCVQRLQSNHLLKGVIIDVRNNPGGNVSDNQYVMGTLYNNYQQIGFLREKVGIGRYDYSPIQGYNILSYSKEHKAIESPIVVLINGNSASMAEITSLSAKQLTNGYTIGTRTFGAFSPSSNSYAITYAGDVGDPSLNEKEDKLSYFSPFYIHIPTYAFLTLDKQVLDGVGVEPDEEIHLDWNEHQTSGRDNQLDRALEYIRTGK